MRGKETKHFSQFWADLRLRSLLHHGGSSITQFKTGSNEETSCNYSDLCLFSKYLINELQSLGIKPGDKVGIMFDPSILWIALDLAIMSMGAVSVPVFPNTIEKNLRYIIKDCDMKLCIVSDCDEISLWNEYPLLFMNLSDIFKPHSYFASKDYLDVFETNNDGDSLATIIYTSGSTGDPKGVMLTHSNLLYTIRLANKVFPLTSEDRALSVLPLAHVFERTVMYSYLEAGTSIYIGDPKELKSYMHVKPTVMTAVPRILEKVYNKIIEQIENKVDSSKSVEWLMQNSNSIIKNKLVDFLVYRKIRKVFGGRMKYLITGGAALNPEIEDFFVNVIGIPVYTGYGMTECSSVVTCNTPLCSRLGSVGKVFPFVQVLINHDNEILVKSPGLMKGYTNDNRNNFYGDWFKTGDLGYVDDDRYLYITGRKKDLMKNSNGKYISPSVIEMEVTKYPNIDYCVVVADDKPFTSALIFTEKDIHNDEMENIIREVNTNFESCVEIKKWKVIKDMPSVENGLLTNTFKIKRNVVIDQHRDIIEEIYHSS